MNHTDNELSMETPDPEGIKENEDMDNDTSDEVKDNVEDVHEMAESSLNAHDSADNDGDERINKNNHVSENVKASEQKESGEEDAPEIDTNSSNYDDARYNNP